MGLCWGSPSGNPKNPSYTSTGNIRAESSKSSNLTSSATSKESRFSASSGDEVYPEGQIMSTPNLRIFTLAELRAATRNFKSDTLLGEGGFGKVFKGWLEDKAPGKHHGSGTVIAVKKLNSESLQGFEEWQSEVNFLGRVSHPNLVKLLGYCLEGSDLLLVYEFMQKGSLENHLFRKGSAVQPLPWDIRMKIAIGAAKGLAFLHAYQKQVIYRDFKPANILLDGSYNAKISDFGLAKLGPSTSRSHVTTRVMGTNGYVAPEYAATGHLYVKSDVYGFGVHLVELLTGLRALDSTRPKQQETLTDWIKPYLSAKKKLKTIMDPKLGRNYPSNSAFQIAHLALRCIEDEPKNRPSMKEVVEVLERVEEEEAAVGNSAVDRKTRTPNQTTTHHRHRTSQVRLGHRSVPGY